uniref:F-box domain-containing protein n=1 Tax=Steinernema glaseri TaxID=37863 RepID=A0A1I7ZZB8_9BILA
MDGVPSAFFERLCATLYPYSLNRARNLSGIFGELAQIARRHTSHYVTNVKDGEERGFFLFYRCTGRQVIIPEEIDAAPKKFVRYVSIHLRDAEKVTVCREIVRRYPYAEYDFVIHCSAINEDWIHLACQLKSLRCLAIRTKLDDNAIPVLQKLADGRKLAFLHMDEEVCESGILKVVKSLLCQVQFIALEFTNETDGSWHSDVVREILEFWSENSEHLKGKQFFFHGENCEGGVQQVEEFMTKRTPLGGQLPLKICSNEECDFIHKEYTQSSVIFVKPSCMYKYDEGEGDERRRLYISFECANEDERRIGKRNLLAGHNGHDDVGLMRATNLLCVLFS